MGRKNLTALLLSATAIFTLTTVRPLWASVQYKITKGDSLWTIARKYDIHVRDIAKANHLRGDETLQLGRVLTIPISAPQKRCDIKPPAKHVKSAKAVCKLQAKLSKSSVRAAPASVSYNVRKGDSLWLIARKRSVSVRDIAQANHLRENDTLRLGRSLSIPVRAAQKSCGKRQQHSRKLVGKNTKTVHVRIASADIGDRQVTGRNQVVRKALAYRGSRYRRGGTSAKGFDCSGFTRYIYRKYGVSLPHSSRAQARVGKPVPRGQLKQGDLVFFSTYRRGISHVGIYIGNGNFVHASTYGRGVRTDNLGSRYYRSRYRGARRVS
ncbi:MAG: NlpC/P60 family protein [Armatimonadota bacterium]|nr:NlpC/P60 family protein [Armatimonadota bacterium]